jgi:hypothetical protein
MPDLESSKFCEAVETSWTTMLGLPVTANEIQPGTNRKPAGDH